MRIGIIGGSFNPPHKLHYQMAEEILKRNLVDKIIYVPTGDKYAKSDLIDGRHRFNMLGLMTDKNEQIEVSDYEIHAGASYTFETLDYFKKQNQTDDIYFIMSSDLILDIEKWKNPDYILENYRIIGLKRKGVEIKRLPEIYNRTKSLQLYDFDMEELSSTLIREEIKHNGYLELEKYLDEKVIEYIIYNKLYR